MTQVDATFIVRVGPDKQIPLTEAEARALLSRLQAIFGAPARVGPTYPLGGRGIGDWFYAEPAIKSPFEVTREVTTNRPSGWMTTAGSAS